ncbi:hypothetical protein U91I_04157 [alpha proteobacterium U9-1i]|nr:hypothetical protein U91I_04157 [alpha proteobacterium U9-1i]
MKRFAIFLLASAAFTATPALAQQQAQQPPAVERMSRQDLRDEVTRLRGYVNNGAVQPSRPTGCVAAENRQFDFWVGEWDVSPTGVQNPMTIGENTISLHEQGCVIMEYWRPFAGPHGHSINSYDATDQKWHQTWADATGRRTEYGGTFQDGVMRLDMENPPPGPNGAAPQRQRMNFQALDANTVRQWGETFDPATNAWTVTWDLTYRRRPGTALH